MENTNIENLPSPKKKIEETEAEGQIKEQTT